MDKSRPVRLNVYYLTSSHLLHTLLNILTLGLCTPYHSAIEIDGIEYTFYGHPFRFSGIMSIKTNAMSMNLAFTRIYGRTSLTHEELQSQAHRLAFNGSDYDLLHWNCNTFTDRFLFLLTERRLPGWVTRAERCLRQLHCLQRYFHDNESINLRIVTALYVRSAGNQKRVFDLLGLANDQRLKTIYQVLLEEKLVDGKLPNFDRLSQSNDVEVQRCLNELRQRFARTFVNSQSITLNEIFDDLPSIERQCARVEHRCLK